MTSDSDSKRHEASGTREEPTQAPELPPFTLRNVAMDIYNGVLALISNPQVNRIVIPIIITLASMICKVIIKKVAYTEIDFKTYMQQIEIANEGELDYSMIQGDTGPIVYPAGFVQIYSWLHWLTDAGENVEAGQKLFGFLFTGSVLLSCVVYTMVPGIPPWTLYLLLLSKRLYSIYVLRLFNDCFTTISMIGVTVLLQQASYWYTSAGATVSFLLTLVAADLYSLAISVKMNALLYLPGFIVVTYFLVGENLLKFLVVMAVIPFIQIMIGWKYLLPFFNDEEASYLRWTYIDQAFNFKRKFLYKWTVNWRFFSEETFLSDGFSKILLAIHVSVLLVFLFTRYISPQITGKSFVQLVKDALLKPHRSTIQPRNQFIDYNAGPKLVFLVLATSNVIGVLFSRSLHYQFLSWYCWQVPFLLYATGVNALVGVPLFIAHEWCWNVFPSTEASSGVLVSLLALLVTAVWSNTQTWFGRPDAELQQKKDQ